MFRNYFSNRTTLLYLYFPNTYSGSHARIRKSIHKSTTFKYPQASALKLPTNVVNINEAEIGRFSPIRVRDLSGPIITAHKNTHDITRIDVTVQSDPHVNKYDCRGAVSLSSSMQSNVPSPFSGDNTHLGMPGSQWGQGYKYLSDHLCSAHYLSLRHEYQGKINKVITIGARKMSMDANASGTDTKVTTTDIKLSAKDKLKKAVKDYGSTVIIFHVTISLLSLGGCYILVSSGVDVGAILKYFNISEGSQSSAVASNTGTFVIAYGIHKIFAPARIAITLTATPFLVRYLRSIGILKNSVNGGGK